MIPYQTRTNKLTGTRHYKDVYRNAQSLYKRIKSRTKRQPYVRSAYFKKDKIFFTFFWKHLTEKPHRIRVNRLKYFAAAIDLIRNSRNHPVSKENPNNPSEILHRFAGLTKGKELFFVQIKEVKRTGKKYLMSVFGPK